MEIDEIPRSLNADQLTMPVGPVHVTAHEAREQKGAASHNVPAARHDLAPGQRDRRGQDALQRLLFLVAQFAATAVS